MNRKLNSLYIFAMIPTSKSWKNFRQCSICQPSYKYGTKTSTHISVAVLDWFISYNLDFRRPKLPAKFLFGIITQVRKETEKIFQSLNTLRKWWEKLKKPFGSDVPLNSSRLTELKVEQNVTQKLYFTKRGSFAHPRRHWKPNEEVKKKKQENVTWSDEFELMTNRFFWCIESDTRQCIGIIRDCPPKKPNKQELWLPKQLNSFWCSINSIFKILVKLWFDPVQTFQLLVRYRHPYFNGTNWRYQTNSASSQTAV